MIFRETVLRGAFIIELERLEDKRGFFARTWCHNEFVAHGINIEMLQANISQNKRVGTVRGLHFAWPPSQEAKLVRCGRGKIHDVILDLRPDSESFGKHYTITLDSKQGNALYIPTGIAHGFQTLEDDCEVAYMMADFYRPELAAGVRFDDPAFAIDWPLPVSLIVERDRAYPDFDAVEYVQRYRLAEGKKSE